MAKGQGTALYAPEQIDAQDPKQITAWVSRELWRISAVLEIALARNVEFLNVAPSKPREGMVRGADGTHWNPGSGQGVYVYYNSAWNKLG